MSSDRDGEYGLVVDTDMDESSDTTGDQQADQTNELVVEELERLLVERGPLTLDDLSAAFADESPELAERFRVGDDEAGRTLLDKLSDLAMYTDAFWRLPDERISAVLHYLRRATFTHRLTASELERDAVDITPDLVALALPRSFQLVDGAEVTTAGPESDSRARSEESLLGPPGWLDGLSPGDLIAVGFDGEHVDLAPIDETALDNARKPTVANALRESFDQIWGEQAPEVHRLVVDAVGLHVDCFATPVPPVAELLDTAGLHFRDAWVGPAAEEWATPLELARRRRLQEILGDADPCCRAAARRALDSWHAWMEAGAGESAPDYSRDAAHQIADDVDHGPVGPVLAQLSSLGRPLLGMQLLGAWSGAVRAAAEEPAATLAYLEAAGVDASGDALRAEEITNAALEQAPDNPFCLLFLSELVEDRGDAQRSLTLQRAAGRPVKPEAMQALEPFVPDRSLGRNDPCSCGSGRKFKTCCARQPAKRPLAIRCQWLLAKATRHLVRTNPSLAQSIEQLFGMWNGGVPTSVLVADMSLFANGGLAKYLDGRGPLLPTDELSAARSWIDQPLRLLRIESADPDGTYEMSDTRSDERLDVVNIPDGSMPGNGETVLARALPAGDQWLLSGLVVAIPEPSRENVLTTLESDVGPFQLMKLLTDLQMADFPV